MKLTEKSMEVFSVVKEAGGRVKIDEICEALGRTSKSITANVNDLVKKDLVVRDKVEVEGEEKPVTYVVLTDAGMSFVPSEDEE